MATLLLLLPLSLLAAPLPSAAAACTFPATSPLKHHLKGLFVFGSSYVDNGNNNYLKSDLIKVNYAPYGVDFELGPSGRFTNGKNVIDLLGERLGLRAYVPVFASPETKGTKIVNGVSFSSGGAGILDETGSIAGVTSLSHQIKNFEQVTLPELETLVGCRSRESLPEYLFVIGIGGNDYTINYFPRRAMGDLNVTLKAFTSTLASSLASHIQKLYNLGARKFMLMSLYPVGCNPIVKATHPNNTKNCVSIYNKAAKKLNIRFKSMVNKSKKHMTGSHFVYVDAYKVIIDNLKHPDSQGFTDTKTACCEMVMPGGSCKRGGSVCANRKTHFYFDGTHPTEAVNKLIAESAYEQLASF